MKKAVVLTHVAFEDAGSLSAVLAERGLSIQTCDACVTDLRVLDAIEPDLLIVMGGPIAAYDGHLYPFLEAEIDLVRRRLAAQRPTLGICLGAQLMAYALGASVHPGTQGKEIGWAPVLAAADAGHCPPIAQLLVPGLHLLHWHGDTFDLPAGAAHLAATPRYPNQAWSLGRYALALQFHPEVQRPGLERWYVGHAAELAGAGVDVNALRRDGEQFAPALEGAVTGFWRSWLEYSLGPAGRRVLIVDDNTDAAATLSMLLELDGHSVRTAHDGGDALAAFTTFEPEVVLLDIGLPDMDGYEVARRIRGSGAGKSALLLAVTGWGQDEDRRRAAEAGFDEHLTKPVDTEVLSRLLEVRCRQ